ncbi:unnamed protein product, partial [Ilex paraguariensis]
MRDLGDALCVLESRSTALEGIIDGDASTRTQLLGNASKALGSASMLVDVELRSSRPSMQVTLGNSWDWGDARRGKGEKGDTRRWVTPARHRAMTVASQTTQAGWARELVKL